MVQRFPPLAVPTAFVTHITFLFLCAVVQIQALFFAMPDHTSPFLSFVEARHEILKCNLRIGVHELTFTKLSADATIAILLQFHKLTKLPDAGTAKLMQLIVDGPLLDDDKKQVVAAINTRLPDDVRSTAIRQSLQHCEHVFNYLSADDWALITNGTMGAKMNLLAKRCASIGLYHPTEKTFAALVGILMFGDPSAQSCAADALALVREFKTMYKSIMARIVFEGTLPPTFPNKVADFKTEYPTWYESAYSTHEPIAPPVAQSVMQQMIALVPCRNTRAGCSIVQTAASTSAKHSDALASLCGALLANKNPSGHMLNNLQIFKQSHGQQIESSSTSSSPASQTAAFMPPAGMLMLMPPHGPRVDVSQISDSALAKAEPLVGYTTQNPEAEVPPVNTSVETMVAAMQAQLHRRITMKRPAAAQEGNVAKRPAAAEPALGIVLGCSKCRHSPNGCRQCKKAGFVGRRGPQP
jgi:hypothetical protein